MLELEKENFLKPKGPVEQQISDYLGPILALEACELIDIKVSGLKGRPSLVLYIDRSSFDELRRLNRLISDALDVENVKANWFSGHYQLEISSPGIDRPLTKKSHFQKALNQLVQIKTNMGTKRGILKHVDLEKGLELETEHLDWEQVIHANIIHTGR